MQLTLEQFMIEYETANNPWNYMQQLFKPAPLMIAEDHEKTNRIIEFESRKQARIDGLYMAAYNRQQEADRRLNAGWNKLDAIPFGQPIHGARDYNYRQKACSQIDKGYQIQQEANDLENRARTAEKNNSIQSNDPLAVEKLTDKLDRLQKAQETMKEVNAYYRKHKTLDGCPASETVIKAAKSNLDSIHGKPFPAYCLSNNNAEISRIKDRIKEIQQKQTIEPQTWTGDGWTAAEEPDDDRIRIYFDDKPDDETRTIVKKLGFKWSPRAGAWQRQMNRNGRYAMNMIEKQLNGGQ